MDLTRWEPRRRLVRSLFDDLFDIVQAPPGIRSGWLESGRWEPAVDIIDNAEKLIVRVELPGVEKKDVKLSLSENNLTIQGEIKRDEEIKKESYYCCERAYGKYARTIPLPVEVDREKVNAKFKNGIIEIDMLKKAEVQPKEIDIEVAE